MAAQDELIRRTVSDKNKLGILECHFPDPDEQRWPPKERLEKETWIKRFDKEMNKEPVRRNAWRKLRRCGCDTFELIDVLYLFTSRGRQARSNAARGAARLFKAKVDKIFFACDKLCRDLSDLIAEPAPDDVEFLLKRSWDEQLTVLKQVKLHLQVSRECLAQVGSYKRDPNDLSLNWMAAIVRSGTGKWHISELLTLIEAGLAAHGERTDMYTEDGLKKRIQRYRKRNNLKATSGSEFKILFGRWEDD